MCLCCFARSPRSDGNSARNMRSIAGGRRDGCRGSRPSNRAAARTAIAPAVSSNVDRGDAISWQCDGQRRATDRHDSHGDGLNGILPLSRGRRHLVEMGRAGEYLAVDGGHFGGVRAIDGYEDDAAGQAAVETGVNTHVLDGAGGSLERGVAEAGVGPIETAKGAETSKGVGIGAVRRPEVSREDSLAAEDAEVIGLGDGSGNVIPAAVLVLRDGHLHAGELGVDLGLEATQDVDWSLAKFVKDPRVAVAVVL